MEVDNRVHARGPRVVFESQNSTLIVAELYNTVFTNGQAEQVVAITEHLPLLSRPKNVAKKKDCQPTPCAKSTGWAGAVVVGVVEEGMGGGNGWEGRRGRGDTRSTMRVGCSTGPEGTGPSQTAFGWGAGLGMTRKASQKAGQPKQQCAVQWPRARPHP